MANQTSNKSGLATWPRTLWLWLDRNILELGREMRLSFLPPLMVYAAAGISGLTSIVGTFFVKDYLNLSAEFLAALGFWAGIPWALKMPLGHLVDLIWRYKSSMVYLGASMIATSLLIMLGLLAEPERMAQFMPVEAWFVLSALLAPVGYVVQDVVADAMTVEAVPRVDDQGQAIAPATLRLMHTTMQTLGRVAIIGGGVFVSLLNVLLFQDAAAMPEEQKVATYIHIYQLALIIPVVSVLGVVLGGIMKRRQLQRLKDSGLNHQQAVQLTYEGNDTTEPNWWILGGGLVFVIFTISMGLSDVSHNKEIIFVGSMAIVLFLMSRLVRELQPDDRLILVGTAVIIFIYRAMPSPGAGQTWWMIDELGFDQQFLAVLSLIGSVLTLFGMFIFRRFMAERSIAYVIVFLTLASTLLYMPIVGMFYGLHQWTAAMTGGIVDAHFIALVDTALESPLGQIAMIPMLAWIANSAPSHLKATFFAVMASFTNLALSASQLGTKYLNQIFTVTREVKDRATGTITTPADYSELGWLMLSAMVLGFVVPIAAVLAIRYSRFKSA
jgi:MFS family permease